MCKSLDIDAVLSMMGSRGLAPLQGVLKGGGAAPFFLLVSED